MSGQGTDPLLMGWSRAIAGDLLPKRGSADGALISFCPADPGGFSGPIQAGQQPIPELVPAFPGEGRKPDDLAGVNAQWREGFGKEF